MEVLFIFKEDFYSTAWKFQLIPVNTFAVNEIVFKN